jgi:hypothetical protein
MRFMVGDGIAVRETVTIEGRDEVITYLFPKGHRGCAKAVKGGEWVTVGYSPWLPAATGALREAMVARLQALEPLVAGMRR